MARSTYIYVVMRNGHAAGYSWVEPSVAGTFTVKHEAHERTPNKDDYFLMRYKDGQLDHGETIPWDKEITGRVKLPHPETTYKVAMARSKELKEGLKSNLDYL